MKRELLAALILLGVVPWSPGSAAAAPVPSPTPVLAVIPNPTPTKKPSPAPSPSPTQTPTPTPSQPTPRLGQLIDIDIRVVCEYAASADPLCGTKPNEVSWYKSYDDFPTELGLTPGPERNHDFSAPASTLLDPTPNIRQNPAGGIIYRERVCIPDTLGMFFDYSQAATTGVDAAFSLYHSFGVLRWTCPAQPVGDSRLYAAPPASMPYLRATAGPEPRAVTYMGAPQCYKVTGVHFNRHVDSVTTPAAPNCRLD